MPQMGSEFNGCSRQGKESGSIAIILKLDNLIAHTRQSIFCTICNELKCIYIFNTATMHFPHKMRIFLV